MSQALGKRHPKRAGGNVAAALIDRLDPLEYVPDTDIEWCDARVDGCLSPSSFVHFFGLCLLGRDTLVEIKSAQRRLNSGQRGRWYIRRRQHETLVENGGVYLLAVYDPWTQQPLQAAVIAATSLDGLLPDVWTDVDGDRCEEGYRQLAWSTAIDPALVEGGDGRGC